MSTIKNVKRKISYFKVVTKTPNSFRDILLYINWLEWKEIYTSIVSLDDKNFLQSLKDDSWFVFWKICWLRMSGLPQIWENWKKDLDDLLLSDEQGLVESTHFLYSASHNIIWVEYNHYWPRIWSLQYHINDRANTNAAWGFAELELQPILNRETINLLDDIKEIKLLEISLPKESIQSLSNNDSNFYDMFKGAMGFWNSWNITITLKQEKNGENPLLSDTSIIKDEMEKFWINLNETYWTLKLRALSLSWWLTKTYDLLQNKMKDEITVVGLWKNRWVDTEDILEKMKASYNKNKDELTQLANYENI